MNFWPLWHLRIREIIDLEIASADKIEGSFESEYTFAAKMLASLRLNDRIQRFCAEIFEPVLLELEAINEELVVDFSGLYDKWAEQLGRLNALRRFVEGGDPEWKAVRGEIEELFGRLKGEQETKILLEEMVHFERSTSFAS